MKRILSLLFLLAFVTVGAQERVPVWPKGKMPDPQGHQIAAMTDEAGADGFNPDKYRIPYLEWFEKPANPNGTCMILISGGSYMNCCDVGLIDMWHRKLTELGVQCVNFVYRTPRPVGLPIYQSAWEDGQRAVRLVRREAARRGFDPEKIGVISMSAGSHLALLLATSSQTPAYARVDAVDDTPCHINWAIVNAPAYVTTDGETGSPAMREGFGPDVQLSEVFKFDEKTCPMSLHHGEIDPYTPAGSTLVYRRLRKMGVPAELHLYPGKGHGAFGFERGVEFMTQMGFLGPVGPEEDIDKRFPSDDARAKYVREDLWPAGKMPDAQEAQGTPYLEWHFPKQLKTKAIQIIYSGGAYVGNGPESFEVTPARRYLNEMGITVVTMRYRTPRPEGLAKHTTAWQDLQRVVRVVRSEAAGYGLDPDRIGIMGSSAGGHLTLMGVTSSRHRSYLPVDEIDKLPCKVQWGIGIYPAYALTDGLDGYNEHGGNEDTDVLAPEFSFDLDTAPMLMIHGDADGYAAMGSVKVWERLRAMGIPAELHTLALREHCFQHFASPGTGSYTWLDRIGEYLKTWMTDTDVKPDFEDAYAQTDEFMKFGSRMYNGAIRPVWIDAETFVYQTRDRSGDAWYRVSGNTKEAITREAFEEARKGRMRGYYDPSDESQYAIRREVKIPSPDSTQVAFIRDNNVWVSKADGSEPWQLSFDGTDGDRYVQIRWSPDGRKIAALRKEVLKERQILLRESRPADQVQPKYRWLDYAKPGDALPQSTPALFNVETRKAVPLSEPVKRDQYFLELGEWAPDSGWFTYEYNQRGHQNYQLCAVEAADGRVRVLADEKTDTFIYYYDLWRYMMPDGKHILWISERDDWRHLYSIDTKTGQMRQLTKGEWNVREIHQVTEDYILMNVNGLHAGEGEDPYNKHVVRLDLKTLKIKDLTPENANHQVTFNPEFTRFVDNWSRPDLPTTTSVRSAVDGTEILAVQKMDISDIIAEGFTMPEVFSAKGRDGVTDIWGTIFRPFNFDPAKKYPVVEYIYAGPHDSHVEKDFMSVPARYYRLLSLGFIVVTIDGMGTDNRSKSFQDVCWQNLKDGGFPDRILWMQAAAKKYKYMDLSKVGIYGYSAGGQNTLSALLFHPEFYKVGVALCGCHDNRMDKIWWNEQWMGYPVGPWYSESSNVDNAWRLEGKLLIINGEMDDNVDPASSLQVVSELVKHNKDFEQYYLPGFTHNLGAEWITRQAFEFFYRNCR